ncbi:MAG: hypothetical protein ACREKN_09035 [Longimicrobiaceae bacterium]
MKGLQVGPKGLAALFLAVALLTGALGGVLLERLLLAPAAVPAEKGEPSPALREGGRGWNQLNPRRLRGDFGRRMARELELSPDQQREIRRVLLEQQRELRGYISAEARPALEEMLAETRSRVEAILSDEQRARLDELRPERPLQGEDSAPVGPGQ